MRNDRDKKNLLSTRSQARTKPTESVPQPSPIVQAPPTDMKKVFECDSTYTLIKKFFIYKVMASNLFINYSLFGMTMSYRLLGKSVTNFLIERTCASIFTGGVTLNDLTKYVAVLEKYNIGTIGCYVVEGVREVNNEVLDTFYSFCMEAVEQVSEGKSESHFALKLTAFISTNVMEKLSQA